MLQFIIKSSKKIYGSKADKDVAHFCIMCNKQFKTRNAPPIHYIRYHGGEIIFHLTVKDK